ncbi:MAG TPA: hypothetical protein VGM88_17150 [Kofleriaceae bacterium]
MSRTSIPSFLRDVRALLYRHEARRAICFAIAGVAGIALLLPWLGLLLGGTRARAFAVLGAAGLVFVLLVVGAIVLGAVVPRRKWGGDAQLARWVGQKLRSTRREVASDLLSVVELQAAAPGRPGAPSKALVEALVTATADRLDAVEPAQLLPAREVRVARRWMLGLLFANAAFVGALPHVVGAGWHRLVAAPRPPFDGAQLSQVPLVGDLDATLTFPAYSKRPRATLPSTSGDVRGLPGTVVSLRARVLVPASAVEIVVEPIDRAEPKTIAAKLDGDQLSAEFTIDRSARYRFAVTSSDGARAIESTPRAIEAETDQPPTVQLVAPADALDVTNLRRVELAYTIEDDFGLGTAELVWEAGKDRGKKPIVLEPAGAARTQGKILWDIAEISVPSGGEVRYWLEAKDNDTIGGPNVGKSRELRLKVVSPREHHEETLARQQELAEKLLKNLGGRLVLSEGTATKLPERDDLNKGLRESVVELGSIGAAYEKDPHTADGMRKALATMKDRLDKLAGAEARIIPKGKPLLKGAFASFDRGMLGELEDDTITLADWLDRERLEGLLDLSDEITAHQKRLADLLSQYAHTKDPRLLDEIEREMRALDRAFADLDKHRRGMPEDVLDQYVHQGAIQAQAGTSCIDEVRALVRAGQTVKAQQKLDQCRSQHEREASALEGSLQSLRGDKFGEEQKKLDEVMNELSDVAKDQDDIAAEANRIFEAYAEKADEIAKDHRREASRKIGSLVDKLRRRIADINESGLTPFAKEELDIVQRRLTDVEKMVSDGDLAEALGMANQAKQSLDTIASELQAALNDDPKNKWAAATEDALDGVGRAQPAAKELIDELQSLSPRPDQIMSADDQRAMERLRRREAMNKGRAQRLADRTKGLGAELPGDAGPELGKKLGTAIEQMGSADERAKGKDPSGTRAATRAAADALAKARDRAKQAARQAQEGSVGDEPIRIPGADEYRAPERFREDLLEAMKKHGAQAPEGYDEQIKRYYQELIK